MAETQKIEEKAAFIASRILIQFHDVKTTYAMCVDFNPAYTNKNLDHFKKKNKKHKENADSFMKYLFTTNEPGTSGITPEKFKEMVNSRTRQMQESFSKENQERKESICASHNRKLLNGYFDIPDNADTAIFNRFNLAD